MSPAEIFRDFRRNYSNCYVHLQFPDSREKHLFRIQQIDESEHPQITVVSRRFGSLILNVCSDYRLFFPTAITGVFQSGIEAFVATRKFGTGYSRGINDSNTTFQPVLHQFTRHHADTLPAQSETDVLIEDMFNQQFLPFNDALQLLDNSEYLSAAISRSFALAPSVASHRGFTLFYRSNPVAELTGQGKISTMYDKSFSLAVEGIINAS